MSNRKKAAQGPLPENPTLAQLEAFLGALPPSERRKLKAQLRPAPRGQPGDYDRAIPVPAPQYSSWDDYLSRTTERERRAWCARKAHKANSARLMSGPPALRITAADVLGILMSARGRCRYCNSLAVERAPFANGRLQPWGHVGRRIGSLGHDVARFNGGDNALDNLSWACNWCNTWPEERIWGATDHGAIPAAGPA